MRFTPIVPFLALAASANAAVNASQMAFNIDQITQVSYHINDIAKGITVANLFDTAPEMLNSFKEIIQATSNDITAMNSKRSLDPHQACLDEEDVEQCVQDLEEFLKNPVGYHGMKRQDDPTYSDIEQQAICSYLHIYFAAHEQLLKTVLDKHGILSLTPFAHPTVVALHALDGVFDEFATVIIGLFKTSSNVNVYYNKNDPTCMDGVVQNKQDLDGFLADVTKQYSS